VLGQHKRVEGLVVPHRGLSLHLAATPQTRGLIGRGRLRLLPRHAWLINTARADVLDYDALAAALRAG
jgi:phosphoglycerate dehydrogenase-like enzyme